MTRTSSGRALLMRLLATGAALSVWFWTQSLIGKHALPISGIGDQLLLLDRSHQHLSLRTPSRGKRTPDYFAR